MSVVSDNGSSLVQSSNDALNSTVLRSSRNAFNDDTILTLDVHSDDPSPDNLVYEHYSSFGVKPS